MRLIDADAEIKRLEENYCKQCEKRKPYPIFGVACTPCWVKDAVEEFDNAVEVEAVPVRRGAWSGRCTGGVYSGICSACGSASIRAAASLSYDYCPHCGTRMDGE